MDVCIQPGGSLVSVDVMDESWDGEVTPPRQQRPRASCVCHSLVHWTLPLHRVLLFSWFFSSSLFNGSFFFCFFFWILQIQLWSWRFPVLTSVKCCSCDLFILCSFCFSHRYFQQGVLCSVVIVGVYCFLFSKSVICSCSQFAKLRSLSLFLCMFSIMI